MNALLLVVSNVLHSRLLFSQLWDALSYAKCAWQLIWLYVNILVWEIGMKLESRSQNHIIRKNKFSFANEKHFLRTQASDN